MTLALGTTPTGGSTQSIFLIAAVVWLSASGHNPLSLDAWVFRRRARRAQASSRAMVTAGSFSILPQSERQAGAGADKDPRDLPVESFMDDLPDTSSGS